jgi:hypothetical protein
MNKLHWKNPEDLKTNIDPFLGFVENSGKGGEKEEKLIPSSRKTKDQGLGQLKMPSKYATILTCSFQKDQQMNLNLKMLS